MNRRAMVELVVPGRGSRDAMTGAGSGLGGPTRPGTTHPVQTAVQTPNAVVRPDVQTSKQLPTPVVQTTVQSSTPAVQTAVQTSNRVVQTSMQSGVQTVQTAATGRAVR
ncbi:MAG: hypothetical protein MUF83_01545 [Acidimicrobiales bacterium]|jgi:hypothetical protein|nr:hypothetical protein [Acidimicrobiales bacterium]